MSEECSQCGDVIIDGQGVKHSDCNEPVMLACHDLIIGDQNLWDMLSDEAKDYINDKLSDYEGYNAF